MFCHSARAVGSYSSVQPPADFSKKKSTGGFYNLELSPCACTYLLGPSANFADAAVGVDADVVDGEGAVGVGAVLGALARRPGRLERPRHR